MFVLEHKNYANGHRNWNFEILLTIVKISTLLFGSLPVKFMKRFF